MWLPCALSAYLYRNLVLGAVGNERWQTEPFKQIKKILANRTMEQVYNNGPYNNCSAFSWPGRMLKAQSHAMVSARAMVGGLPNCVCRCLHF